MENKVFICIIKKNKTENGQYNNNNRETIKISKINLSLSLEDIA